MGIRRGLSIIGNMQTPARIFRAPMDSDLPRLSHHRLSSMPVSPVLYHLWALDESVSGFLPLLYAFIRPDEKGECVLNLRQHESAPLVNFLDVA